MYNQTEFKNGTQVLCSFYAKPITLAVAVIMTASVLIQMISGFIDGIGFTLDLYTTCLAIGFFMLYFRAKNSNVFTNFNAPLTLIKVASIIFAVLIGIALATVVMILFFSFLLKVEEPQLAEILTKFSLVGSVMLFVYMLYSIGFAVFSSSMKKTSLALDIKKRGSLLTGVSAVLFVITTIVCVNMYITSIDEIIEVVLTMINNYLASVDSMYDGFKVLTKEELVAVTDFIPSGLGMVMSCVNMLSIAAYTFYYNIYMRKVEKDYAPERPVHTTPYHNLYGNQQKASVDFKKAAAIDPMYAAAAMSTLPKDRVNCPYCNSVVEVNLKLCPMCGHKFEEQN